MTERISSATRNLRGNPSGRKVRALAGEGDIWAPPKWFNKVLRDQWNYALETSPKGLLAGSDRDVLVAWCVACVGHAAAAKALMKEEMVMEYDNGIVAPNPKLAIMQKHGDTMFRLSKVLGFNPASRLVLGSVSNISFDSPGQIGGSVVSFIDQKPSSLAA